MMNIKETCITEQTQKYMTPFPGKTISIMDNLETVKGCCYIHFVHVDYVGVKNILNI